MTNIWAEGYKEIRKPFFEIEDPYIVNEEKRNYSSKKEKEDEDEDDENKEDDEEDDKKEKKDKPKRWWDDDGDGIGWEKGEVKKSSKKVTKEERDLNSRKDKNEKIDVRKGIKNKIEINPKEELEAWIHELLSEGYDLSEFTLEELEDIYNSAENLEEQVLSAGDAETVKPDPLTSAKRNAAKAQIKKEYSDTKLAREKTTTESVLTYISKRNKLFS